MTGARRALVVASDAYDAEGLRDLRSPRADAEALAAVLGDPQVGDFDVDVVHNEPSYVVQAQVEELFAEAAPDDLVLLHLSCHGLKSESGDLFFATRNTRLGRLESTAVPASFVQRCMRASRSRSIVLLLDCCYGGAFGTGVSVRAAGPVDVVGSFPAGRLEGGRGRAVITASSAMEYSFEGTRLADDRTAPSVFTEALVRGLTTGEADRDEDGWVSLNELYDYVFEQVRTSTPGQTPTRDVEMQGELYLARSRRRRVQPGPLPPDLLTASHDANVFTRLGAVSELRARLLGDNLPAAAGAHRRLVEMSEQDISYVATAAASAVEDAAFGCDPLQVDLGEVDHGVSAPARRVVTTGPPLARTCVIETSDPRIRVLEDGGDLEVSVDTAVVGEVSGTVTVRSLLGRRVVHVAAVVTPVLQPVVPEPVVPEPVVPAPGPVPERDPEPEPERASEPELPQRPGPPSRLEVVPAAVPDEPRPVAPARSVVPRDTSDHEPAHLDDGDLGWVRVVGGLTLAGAGLLLVGTQADYQWGDPLWVRDLSWFWYSTFVGALLVVAGASMLWPRPTWSVGAGLVLGAGAASTWGLVTTVTFWAVEYREQGDLGAGFWLLVTGYVVVLAGVVTLARRLHADGRASIGASPLPRAAVGALLAAGAVTAVLVIRWRPDVDAVHWLIPAWLVATGVAVPVVTAYLRPRSLGVWLLLGWSLGAGAGLVLWLRQAGGSG